MAKRNKTERGEYGTPLPADTAEALLPPSVTEGWHKPGRRLPETHAAADLLERFKDFPAIDVISRRLLDPNDPGSLPILLKDEAAICCLSTDHQRMIKPGAVKCHLCKLPVRAWHVHWCNGSIDGRWAQLKAKGYVPVLVSELADREDVADLVKQTEENGSIYVRRGDRGKEVLMKQPLEVYAYLKAEQAKRRRAQLRDPKALQRELAERAGSDLGSEAGDYVARGGITVESMTRERTTLGEEAGD
jgi:hypothetical protein